MVWSMPIDFLIYDPQMNIWLWNRLCVPRTMSLTQLGSANTSRMNSGGPSGRLCSMVGPYARKKRFAQDMHGKFLPIRGSKPISERTEALILHRTDFLY